jgi:serine/threonine-protein kinase SRPK3
MNGSHIKQAAIQKAKQVANTASNGNATKKRKKDLKPIITTESQQQQDADSAAMASSNQASAG